jgi:hypothetical protein
MAKLNNIGSIIDKMWAIREQERELGDKINKLIAQRGEYEETLKDEMKKQGLDQARGTKASATYSEPEVPTIGSWSEFEPWMVRSKKYYFLQKRLSPAAVLEELANRKGKAIPGIVVTKKPKIELRTVKR